MATGKEKTRPLSGLSQNMTAEFVVRKIRQVCGGGLFRALWKSYMRTNWRPPSLSATRYGHAHKALSSISLPSDLNPLSQVEIILGSTLVVKDG